MCEIKARLTICGFGTESQRDSKSVKYLHLRTNNYLLNQLELKQRMVLTQLCGNSLFPGKISMRQLHGRHIYVVISLPPYTILWIF